MEAIKLAGINKFMIVIAPQTKHGIIDGLQSGSRIGVDICYVIQEKPEDGLTGMGLAVLSTKNWMGKEDFVVACGDTILCNFSLKNPLNCLEPLLEAHSSVDAIATILVHPIKTDPSRFGLVRFKNFQKNDELFFGELESLVEKPGEEILKLYRANSHYFSIAGYYVFSPRIFDYIEQTEPGAKNEIQITDSMALALENGEKVFGLVHGTKMGDSVIPYPYWDVGVPEDYKNVNQQLLELEIDRYLI
jgi:dTDP-glucose pyrophosphorylase